MGRVTLGGFPPRVPTDPYVLALEHTVPQIEVATDGRSNGPREPAPEDSAPPRGRNVTMETINVGCQLLSKKRQNHQQAGDAKVFSIFAISL